MDYRQLLKLSMCVFCSYSHWQERDKEVLYCRLKYRMTVAFLLRGCSVVLRCTESHRCKKVLSTYVLPPWQLQHFCLLPLLCHQVWNEQGGVVWHSVQRACRLGAQWTGCTSWVSCGSVSEIDFLTHHPRVLEGEQNLTAQNITEFYSPKCILGLT